LRGTFVYRSVDRRHSAPPPAFLSVNEAAALLHLCLVTLGRWRIEGRYKFGRRVVYSRDGLVRCPMSKADDLSEARVLVGGYVEEDAKGRRRSKYLRPGTDEERRARQALARLFRAPEPLDPQLRDGLAGLFDPDPPAGEQRKIEFVGRRPGALTDYVRDTQIAYYIWEEVERGERVRAAVKTAADEFAISADRATQIWSGYRPLLESMHGPLRRGRVKT
jgi:hypothetical protein